MRRRLLNLAMVLSLVLLVATAAMWVRSYERLDVWMYWSPKVRVTITSGTGSLSFVHQKPIPMVLGGSVTRFGHLTLSPELLSDNDRVARFAWGRDSDHRYFGVPYWGLFVLFVLTPILWFVLRRGHFGAGRCDSCGYDLTANVSGVCPECGNKIATISNRGAPPH